MDKIEFIKGMKYLGTAYNKEFTDEQAGIWYEFFMDVNYDTFRQAVKRILTKEDYMPSIARVKKEIALIENESLQLDMDDEWAKVLRLIGKYGSDREQEALKELSPYTANVVEMIGWRYLCQSPISQRQWNEKEFKTLMQNKNINLSNYEVVGHNATERELTYKEQLLEDEREYDRRLELEYEEV